MARPTRITKDDWLSCRVEPETKREFELIAGKLERRTASQYLRLIVEEVVEKNAPKLRKLATAK